MTKQDRSEYMRNYMRDYQRKRRLETNNEFDRKYRETHPEVIKKYREDHKEYYQSYNDRRVKFKGRYVLIPKRTKIGICTDCGKSVQKGEISYTVSHHTQYDEKHPEKYTVELCSSCHRERHIFQYSMTYNAIKQRESRARRKTKVTEGSS